MYFNAIVKRLKIGIDLTISEESTLFERIYAEFSQYLDIIVQSSTL